MELRVHFGRRKEHLMQTEHIPSALFCALVGFRQTAEPVPGGILHVWGLGAKGVVLSSCKQPTSSDMTLRIYVERNHRYGTTQDH